jgi:hypothetical protein
MSGCNVSQLWIGRLPNLQEQVLRMLCLREHCHLANRREVPSRFHLYHDDRRVGFVDLFDVAHKRTESLSVRIWGFWVEDRDDVGGFKHATGFS